MVRVASTDVAGKHIRRGQRRVAVSRFAREFVEFEKADAEFAARVAAERGSPIETTVPLQVVKAKLDGAHPLKAWREHRGITQAELASRSAVARDLIAQIETHKKQGSVATLDRLARALSIPIEALIAEQA